MRHGKGIEYYPDGSLWYEGEYKDGYIHGKGVMTYANKDVYDGQWKNDRKHGQGTMKFNNGDVYEGEFSKGKMHGKGAYTYAAGPLSKSTGEWKEGKKCGFFEDIVRLRTQVFYENDKVKVDPNVKREAPSDEDTVTNDAPPRPRKRRNVCVSPR